MANRIEIWPQQRGDAMDRAAVLRNVMEILSVKGFAKASTADLTSATGLGYSALHKAFGTKGDILRAAIQFCAETEASLAHEPLRASPTGREAILSMLEENVRLRRHWLKSCGCLFTLNTSVIPTEDVDLQEFLSEKRRTLLKQIRSRLAQSVSEGELPESANCEALANLCFTLLAGLTFRVAGGTPPRLLFRSIEMFVSALGFTSPTREARPHVARSSRPRRERNR
jgi:AcrR family transcriptional regulator